MGFKDIGGRAARSFDGMIELRNPDTIPVSARLHRGMFSDRWQTWSRSARFAFLRLCVAGRLSGDALRSRSHSRDIDFTSFGPGVSKMLQSPGAGEQLSTRRTRALGIGSRLLHFRRHGLRTWSLARGIRRRASKSQNSRSRPLPSRLFVGQEEIDYCGLRWTDRDLLLLGLVFAENRPLHLLAG